MLLINQNKSRIVHLNSMDVVSTELGKAEGYDTSWLVSQCTFKICTQRNNITIYQHCIKSRHQQRKQN